MADRRRAHDLAYELKVACAAAGLTQRELGRRLGMSQTSVSRLLTGAKLHLDAADAIARACGHRLQVRVVPGDGLTLRDSGQLALAQMLERSAHPAWQVRLEVPVASPPDRRAVDLVLIGADEIVAVEIERRLHDLQAQLRAAQLKRLALSERSGRPVRLILAVPDTAATRARLRPFTELLERELGVPSHRAWARIRSGQPLGGDALLWVRRR